MRKRMNMLIVLFLLVIVCGCSKSSESKVYKYYSLTVSPTADNSESSDSLESAFGKELFDKLLQDSYLELQPDGTFSLYTSLGTSNEANIEDYFGENVKDADYEIDGEMLHFNDGGWILSFKEATPEEVSIYKQLVKSSQKSQEQNETDSVKQTEALIAASEAEETPEKTSVIETEKDEGYHMENIPIPENEGSMTLVATGAYCLRVSEGDEDNTIPPGKYIFVPVYPKIIKTQDHEYPASWMIYVTDKKYSYFSELSYLDYVGDAGGVSQHTIEIEVAEGDYVYAIDLHENNADDPENGFSVGECEMCWLGE